MRSTSVSFFAVLLIFLLSLFSGSSLLAQTKKDKDTARASKLAELSLEQLMNIDITTVSKKTEKVSEAPATVYVITKEEIKKRGYVQLKDVLRDLPGMETIENYFAQIGTLVPVRGVIGNNKIVVLINGRRVNPPGGEEFPLRSDFNIMNAKQIEVVYGLGATLYGQDAINAVINIITEQADNPIKVDVMAKGGMYSYKEAVASISGRINYKNDNFIGITSSFSYTDAELSNLAKVYPEFWEKGYGKVIQNTGIPGSPKRFEKGLNAFLKVENNSSSIQVWHRESSRNSGEGGFAGFLLYTNEARYTDRTTAISANNIFSFTDKIKLTSTLSYNRYEVDPQSLLVNSIRDTGFIHNWAYSLGTGLRAEEKLDYEITRKFSLTAGIMTAFYEIIPLAFFPDKVNSKQDIYSQGEPLSYYTRKGDPGSLVQINNVFNLNYRNYGSYAEGRYSFSEKLKAILGLRADIDTRFAETPFSPRFALIYNPSHFINFKYIFNRGYLAPAPFYMFNVFDAGTRINTFNLDLKPEQATSNEININYFRNHLSIGTAFYYKQQENLIFLGDAASNKANIVQDTIWADAEGKHPKRLTRHVNSGKSRSLGTDLFVKYQTEKLSLWASFSYVDFERDLGVEKTGLNRISPINVRLGISWMPVSKLTITPSLIFKTTPPNFINKFGLDEEIKNPYELNTYIAYEPIEGMTVFLDGRNITNHKYALKGNTSPAPQEPIRILGGVRYILK